MVSHASPPHTCTQDVERKGRLMPGNIFLVDFDAHDVIDDEAVSRGMSHPHSGISRGIFFLGGWGLG